MMAGIEAAAVVADAVDWIVDLATAAARWATDMTTLDWVLLAVGIACLAWVVQSLRASVRLGTVEVEDLSTDDKGIQVKALTSSLRERLSDGGIAPPPAVPAGAPDAALTTAVEAVVPHGPLVAKILAALPDLPGPADYTLTTTLVAPAKTASPRVKLWLRPSGGGKEMLDTVEDKSVGEAVEAAADLVQRHVSEHGGAAVPMWARWTDEQAFAEYVSASRRISKGEDEEALRAYRGAAEGEPANLVVRMRMANLVERAAGLGPNATDSPDAKMLLDQSAALREYLRARRIEPTLVEARYRASILASMIASTIDDDSEDEGGELWQRVGGEIANQLGAVGVELPRPDIDEPADGQAEQPLATTVAKLRELADDERDAVRGLLRPWYTLLAERRLRHELEPRGASRRRMLRGVKRSRVIARLRQQEQVDTPSRWLAYALRHTALSIRKIFAIRDREASRQHVDGLLAILDEHGQRAEEALGRARRGRGARLRRRLTLMLIRLVRESTPEKNPADTEARSSEREWLRKSRHPHGLVRWLRYTARQVSIRFRYAARTPLPGKWQARYNAACLLALLVARADDAKEAVEAAKPPDLRRYALARARRHCTLRLIRTTRSSALQAAYKQLDIAIQGSRGELSPTWVLSGDRDLEELRPSPPDAKGEPGWELIRHRYLSETTTSHDDKPPSWSQAPRALLVKDEHPLSGDPEGPWHDPMPALASLFVTALLFATTALLAVLAALQV